MSDLTIPGHTDEISNGKHQLLRSILLHRGELVTLNSSRHIKILVVTNAKPNHKIIIIQ